MSTWKLIAEDLIKEIETGAYPAGYRIPSEVDLAVRYLTSRSTAHRAIEFLETNGYVETRKRAGTFVLSRQPDRKHMVALIFDRVAKHFDFPSSEMIEGIRHSLGDQFGLVLCDSKNSIHREANFISRMAKETDGVICFPIADQRDGSLLQQIHESGTPVVVIDRIPKGYAGSSVISEDFEATKKSIQYLVSKGHKNIGFIGFLKETVSSAMERHRAFIEGMHESLHVDGEQYVRWLGKDIEHNGSVLERSVFDTIFSLTKGEEQITALYCIQDDLALKSLNAAARIGLNVPNELEIVTVNEWPALQLHRPWDLHRIVRDKYGIGVAAAKSLLSQIENPKHTDEIIRIPADLILSSPDNLPPLDGVQAWLEDEQKPTEII